MKITKAESKEVGLKVSFVDGSIKWFCGEAIKEFYQLMGEGIPVGKEFDSDKFMEISNKNKIDRSQEIS